MAQVVVRRKLKNEMAEGLCRPKPFTALPPHPQIYMQIRGGGALAKTAVHFIGVHTGIRAVLGRMGVWVV